MLAPPSSGASVSRSELENGVPWNFKGVVGKAKNCSGYHCVRLRPVFRLDLGVFPVDGQVETNEVKNLRRRNVTQAF